jgi:hypothetical protein
MEADLDQPAPLAEMELRRAGVDEILTQRFSRAVQRGGEQWPFSMRLDRAVGRGAASLPGGFDCPRSGTAPRQVTIR